MTSRTAPSRSRWPRKEVLRRHWAPIELDERLSDPDGCFLVFSSGGEPNEQERVPVKVVLRLNEAGGLLRPHREFDEYVIGSPTLWLAEATGDIDRKDPDFPRVDHWIWMVDDGSIWRGDDPPARGQDERDPTAESLRPSDCGR